MTGRTTPFPRVSSVWIARPNLTSHYWHVFVPGVQPVRSLVKTGRFKIFFGHTQNAVAIRIIGQNRRNALPGPLPSAARPDTFEPKPMARSPIRRYRVANPGRCRSNGARGPLREFLRAAAQIRAAPNMRSGSSGSVRFLFGVPRRMPGCATRGSSRVVRVSLRAKPYSLSRSTGSDTWDILRDTGRVACAVLSGVS